MANDDLGMMNGELGTVGFVFEVDEDALDIFFDTVELLALRFHGFFAGVLPGFEDGDAPIGGDVNAGEAAQQYNDFEE